MSSRCWPNQPVHFSGSGGRTPDSEPVFDRLARGPRKSGVIVGTGEGRSMLPTGPVAPVEVVPGARGGIQIAVRVGELTQRPNPQRAEDRGTLDVRGVGHNGARARKAVTRRTDRVAR